MPEETVEVIDIAKTGPILVHGEITQAEAAPSPELIQNTGETPVPLAPVSQADDPQIAQIAPIEEPPSESAQSVKSADETPSAAAAEPAPAVAEPPAAAPATVSTAPKVMVRRRTLELPLAESFGYQPAAIELSLTGAEAVALADLAAGLAAEGIIEVGHVKDAIRWVLAQLA